VPEGVLVEEGKAYNPYFPNGSVLAMPQQLFDDGIEYKDGTPATMSQQAKDVTTVGEYSNNVLTANAIIFKFLRWASESFHDDRKKYFIKVGIGIFFVHNSLIFLLIFQIALVLPIIVFVLLYQKRHVWSTIKSEKVFHRTIKGREWTPNSPHPQPPKEAPSIKKVN
jgi:ubiquinol-cytochrome c reductase cytochrome c1 subunit